MVIFFTIFFALIAINASLLIFSALNSNSRSTGDKAAQDSEATKIYPLDLNTSKYKKAI